MRVRNTMRLLKRQYKAALKSNELQAALYELLRAVDSETAAIIYADPIHLNDLIILTMAVENRRLIEELRKEIAETSRILNSKINYPHPRSIRNPNSRR